MARLTTRVLLAAALAAPWPARAAEPAAAEQQSPSYDAVPVEAALEAPAPVEKRPEFKPKSRPTRKPGLKRLPLRSLYAMNELAGSLKSDLQSDRVSGAMQRLGGLFQGQAARGAAAPVRIQGFSRPRYLRQMGNMDAFLHSVNGKGSVTVTVEGKSAGGRPLYLVHLSGGGQASWRVFFYAQQHGDEVSGREALLRMIREISEKPRLLPPGVDLWIMPSINPDGVASKRRENAANSDVNRDHMELEQPETRTLHRIFRKLRPQVAVDCHEFNWDEDFKEKGWSAWPVITMDGLNNPSLDPSLTSAALRWVNEAEGALRKAGHAYLRYSVGGLPPEDERRYSAPDMDSALNSLGAYGGLSFIIEANRAAPLGRRVDAYGTLLWRFIQDSSHRREDLATIERARQRPLPQFLPTNYFWANRGPKTVEFPVRDAATGQRKLIATPNFMTDLVVKASVPMPRAYVIDAASAKVFRELLERQGIPYEAAPAAQTMRAERCRLLRVEKGFDEIYNRYEGRQIVRLDDPVDRQFPAGSLIVSLTGDAALRAALLLEPSMIYGLYQYPKYRALVGPDGVCPVWRIPR